MKNTPRFFVTFGLGCMWSGFIGGVITGNPEFFVAGFSLTALSLATALLLVVIKHI